MKERVIGFRVPVEIAVELERLAREKGKSVSDLVREAVKNLLTFPYIPSYRRARCEYCWGPLVRLESSSLGVGTICLRCSRFPLRFRRYRK